MIAPLAISIEGLQVAAAGVLGVLLAVTLVRVLLWVTEREALEHALAAPMSSKRSIMGRASRGA